MRHHYGWGYGSEEQATAEEESAEAVRQREYEERFAAQEAAFLLASESLLAQTDAAERERQRIAEQMGLEIGIRTYTDEERTLLGITGADIADLYDTERQQTLQDVQNRLETIQSELGGDEPEEERPLPWGWIAVGGVAVLIAAKFALK